jgi:hypothetical protein
VRDTSVPSSRTAPSVVSSNPAIIRKVVVLPHPDGPSSEKNSPAAMSKQASSTATKSPKRFVTWSSSMTAAAGTAPATAPTATTVAFSCVLVSLLSVVSSPRVDGSFVPPHQP